MEGKLWSDGIYDVDPIMQIDSLAHFSLIGANKWFSFFVMRACVIRFLFLSPHLMGSILLFVLLSHSRMLCQHM